MWVFHPRSWCPFAARERPKNSKDPTSGPCVTLLLLRSLPADHRPLAPSRLPPVSPSIASAPGGPPCDAAAHVSSLWTQARRGRMRTLSWSSCFKCAKQAKGSTVFAEQGQGSATKLAPGLGRAPTHPPRMGGNGKHVGPS